MTPASGASAWWKRRVWSPGRWSRECRPSRASAGAEDRPRRRKEALLLPDGVLRLRGPREVDDRELALHLDDRAVAGLPLVRAQLRAGVRVDERLAHLEHVDPVPDLDPGQRAQVDPGPGPFDLDDPAFDTAGRGRRSRDPRPVLARRQDRKSTRLNSSHGSTSYAV